MKQSLVEKKILVEIVVHGWSRGLVVITSLRITHSVVYSVEASNVTDAFICTVILVLSHGLGDNFTKLDAYKFSKRGL